MSPGVKALRPKAGRSLVLSLKFKCHGRKPVGIYFAASAMALLARRSASARAASDDASCCQAF